MKRLTGDVQVANDAFGNVLIFDFAEFLKDGAGDLRLKTR
jgi:hypothetical protein